MRATKYVKFNVVAETHKALRGKKAKVSIYTLFQVIAPDYLQMLQAEKEPPKFRPVNSTSHSLRDDNRNRKQDGKTDSQSGGSRGAYGPLQANHYTVI
jgi:hypothetical protein